jgi:chromosome segregation ATPase
MTLLFSGEIRSDVDTLATTLTTTRNAVAEVLTKMSSLEAQGTGVNIFVEGIQNYVAELTANQTRINNVIDTINVDQKLGSIRALVSGVGSTVQLLHKNVTHLQSEFIAASRSSSDVASTVNTLKTNVIGLGNYINSINREVNSLAGKTKDSIENLNQQVVELTANVNSIETELSSTKKSNDNLKNEFSSGDFVASTLRTDVAGLSTKLYTLKTSVFEMTSELSGVKSGLQTLNSDVKTVNKNIQSISNKILVNEQTSKNTKSDLSTLRSGLSGLTNSIFSVKSQIKSIENIDSKIAELSKNITGVTDVVSVTRSEFSKIKPEVDLIATDITTIRNGMSRMTKAVQSIADPPRFSCGVTGDEIKVSGVITYDECTVNREKMMNAVSFVISMKNSSTF